MRWVVTRRSGSLPRSGSIIVRTRRRYSRTVVGESCSPTWSSQRASSSLSGMAVEVTLPAETSPMSPASARCASRLVPCTVRLNWPARALVGSRGS